MVTLFDRVTHQRLLGDWTDKTKRNVTCRQATGLPKKPMDILDLVQWPAMLVTLAASWLVASRSPQRRSAGFWVFLLSNALWVAWGWHTSAMALIALQVGLAAFNIRGAVKADQQDPSDE